MAKKLCCIALAIFAIPAVALSQSRLDLTAVSARIEPEIAKIRSLNFVRPFTVRYQTSAEIRAFINAGADELPQNYRQNYDRIIRAIGLHRGGDPVSIETITGATQGQVAAYYDPATRSINFPLRTYFLAEISPIMAHELVHALQDMHFGLARMLDAANSDQLIAQQALVEGDATLVQTLWEFAAEGQTVSDNVLQILIDGAANRSVDEIKQGAKNSLSDPQAVKEIENTPDFFWDQFITAYYRGTAFVFALKRRGGWPAVNRAFANPPSSSEHIFHPDKYIAGESPEEIALPDLAGETFAGDWELLDMDTLGEFGFRLIFNVFDIETSHAAAAGWHGDQYAVFKHRQENTPALVLFTTWDTERDATEFMTAYQRVLDIKLQGDEDFKIDRRGTDVLIAESPRALDLDALFAYAEKVRAAPALALTVFDFDGDLTIDFDDFLAFASHYGRSSSDPDFDPRFDFDGDGTVGFSDFLRFAAEFGKTIAPTPNAKPAVAIDPRFIHSALGFVR